MCLETEEDVVRSEVRYLVSLVAEISGSQSQDLWRWRG